MTWILLVALGFIGSFSALMVIDHLRGNVHRAALRHTARDEHIAELERECEIRDEKGDLVHPPIPPRSIDVRTYEDGRREITFEEKGRAWMEYHRTGDPTYIDHLIERLNQDRPGTFYIHPTYALAQREEYDLYHAKYGTEVGRLNAVIEQQAALSDALSREQRRIAASSAIPTIRIDERPDR